MTKPYKLKVAIFALCFFAFFSASAATPPKVVFIGDWITYYWTNIAAHPGWINEGGQGIAYFGKGSSGEVLARFQADVVDLHPQIVHIMVGQGDASATDDASIHLTIPGLLNNLEAMVKQARAADIQVILGIEPTILGGSMGGGADAAGLMNQMNSVIAAFGARHHIPVINYGDALCSCVGSVTPPSGIGFDFFDQYGGGPFLAPSTLNLPFPNDYGLMVTAGGYAMMTKMAENALATMNLKLEGGWLQNIEQFNDNTNSGPTPDVNIAPSAAAIQFTPIGFYSDGSQHPLLNSDFVGSNGHWESSDPLVMHISQTGLASALTPGTTIIRYTSPDGVRFAEWIMYVTDPVG